MPVSRSEPTAILAVLSTRLKELESTPATRPAPTTDAPPPYDEAVQKTLDDPETAKCLEDEVAKLTNAAQEVEIAFREVSRGLEKIVTTTQDRNQSEKYKKLRMYKSKWDGLHKKYVELLWESRRVAGNARAIALDFAGDFLDVIKDEGYSIEEKMKEIAAYREALKKDKKNADRLAQGFVYLHTDVGAFREDIKEILSKWGEEVQTKVTQTVDMIKKLEEDLKQAKNRAIKALAIGAGLGVAAGVVTAIGFFCPVLWIASAGMILVGTVYTVRAFRNYYALVRERDGMNKLLEEHTKDAEIMSKTIASAGKLDNDMVVIQDKLEIFASVWQIIHSDLGQIEEKLKLATDSSGKLIFQKRIKTVSTAYKTFSRALRLYETNVHIKHSD